MISRCNHFRDEPLATKRAARSSSRSGCVGSCPCVPKSDGVRTKCLPKCQPQTRLTQTRAASGPASPTILSANSKRPEPCSKGVGSPCSNTLKNRRGTISPGLATLPRTKTGRSRGCAGRKSIRVTVGVEPSTQTPQSMTAGVMGTSYADSSNSSRSYSGFMARISACSSSATVSKSFRFPKTPLVRYSFSCCQVSHSARSDSNATIGRLTCHVLANTPASA